ncbi:MAG TPA: succinylglutamate-semialdehyde dehydrogenase, partial [Bdellovibrionales bacterium]|nr:succinylglutamate-semialdehyde dehydrogenase [Bdellovibrionales bacterium]
DLKDQVITIEYEFNQVDEACKAAKEAFPSWAALSLDQRKSYLLRLKEIFLAHADEMAEVISRETGKPFWETQGEARALANKIDVTLNDSLKLVADQRVDNALPGTTGFIRYKPRGVMAVLGPFNFPAHLPNGHIIPALATGNTVVFKPSELTPATGQLLAQFFERAQFPKGVFNLVQGRGPTGERLVLNESVEGVLLTGSYEVGLKIKQATMTHFWKIAALEMGGKNASIVWDDADLEKAVFENIIGAFSSTGQRCSCTSRLILGRGIADQFISRFYEAAKKLSIGHWSEKVFMGPLINEAAVEKYIRFQGIAKREGCESLMRGKTLDLPYQGYYVTPSINIVSKPDPESIYQKTELFAPNVAIYTVDDFDEAVDIVNSSSYGLVLSVFSKDRSFYDRALSRARVGLVNWNRATVGASSRLPFGGMGKSGNHQPSAHFAVYYCTAPYACLEDTAPLDKTKAPPGMRFDD